MFENVKSLTVRGGGYGEEATLNIFENRFNVLYGCNGSGKSTIARAMRQIASGGEVQDFKVARLNEVKLSNEEKKRIYVFDQHFIDENVGIVGGDKDGLSAIVMLGSQVHINDDVQDIDMYINQLEHNIANLIRENKNSFILQKYFMLIKGRLESGWCKRDIEIHKGKKAVVVDETFVNKILNYESQMPKIEGKDLEQQFNHLLKIYKSARNGNKINFRVANIPQLHVDALQTLLEKKIQNPELNDRDRALLSIAKNISSSRLESMHRDFVENSMDICPYCFQPISDEHKDELCKSISLALNEYVEKYKRDVQNLVGESFGHVVVDFGELSENRDYDNLINECKAMLGDLNEKIDQIRKIVDDRIEYLYVDFRKDIVALGVNLLVDNVNSCINNINHQIELYNDAIEHQDANLKELEELNNQLAVSDILGLSSDYRREYEQLNDRKREIYRYKNQLEKEKNRKGLILNEQKNYVVAIDLINESLEDVYGDKDRLKLKLNRDGYYEVLVNGKQVKPSRISTGERNIIGLCYFFTQLYENENSHNKYDHERLLVIDDPISSFDTNNKLGVMTMMRRHFNKIIYHNRYSKILVMSHDMQTVQDLMGYSEELKLSKEDKEILNSSEVMVLSNHKVEMMEWKGEYMQMLEAMYRYAQPYYKADGYEDLTMGNVMRRVLEAYATFNFRSNMKWLFRDNKILGMLADQDRRYYENKMYRLFLNGDSHEVDNVRNGNYIGYTPKEKQQTARDILMLMNLLTPMHIRTYLGEANQKVIDTWHTNLFEERVCEEEPYQGEMEQLREKVVEEKVRMH